MTPGELPSGGERLGAGHFPWFDDPEWFVRRVAAFLDRPGTLPGAGVEVYSHTAMCEDVRGFLAAVGVGRADVVGHSLGGAVAYLLAQRHPELVRRLVLEDVPAPVPLDPPRPVAVRPDGPLPFDWAMVRATDAQRNAPDPGWWDGMSRITAPSLLVGGGPSSIVPQHQVALLARLIPDARTVTVDAGHLVHGTRPEEFLAAVRPFLDGEARRCDSSAAQAGGSADARGTGPADHTRVP